MSVQASSWVIEHSKSKGSARLVLLMIANHAHADGTNAFPSVTTLAKECLMSDRQITRIIQALEASGELQIDRSAGRRSHRYSLLLMTSNPDKMSPLPVPNHDKLSGLNGDKMSGLEAGNPDISGSNPDIAMSYEPSLEPKERNTPSGALCAVSPTSPDPSSTLWRYGVKVLCVEGESESAVRGIIGKEMKRGAAAVMAGLQETERARPVDPKSYFRAVMKKRASASEICANYVATAMAERRKEYEENARRGVGGPSLGRGSKENRGVQETNPRVVSVDAANAA